MAKAAAVPKGNITPSTIAFLESIGRTDFNQAPTGINNGTVGRGGSSGGGSSVWDGLKGFGAGFLDVLSRPLYATAGFTKAALGDSEAGLGENVLDAAWKGLEGKTKNTFGDVIQQQADIQEQTNRTGHAEGFTPNEGTANPWLKGLGGFAGDVIFDPLTYVGPGIIKAAIKAPFQVGKALGGSTDLVKSAETAVAEAERAKSLTSPTDYGSVRIPEAAPIETPTAAVKPVVEATPKQSVDDVLKELDSAVTDAGTSRHSRSIENGKPNYGYGGKLFTPSFRDSVHKALFVIAGKGESKTHGAHMDFLRSHFPGETDRQIKERGLQLRQTMKEQAAKLPHGAEMQVADHPAAYSGKPINPSTPAYVPAADVVTAAAVDPEIAAKVVSHNLKPSSIAKEALTPEEATTIHETANKYLEETNRAGYLKKGKVRDGTGTPHFNLAKQLNALEYALKHHVTTHGLWKNARIDKGLQLSGKSPRLVGMRNVLGAKLLPHIEDTMTALGKPPVGFGRLKHPDIVRLSDLLAASPIPKGRSIQAHLGDLVKEFNGPIENMSPGIRAIHDASQDAADVIEHAHATQSARNAAEIVNEAGTDAAKAQAAVEATKAAASEGEVVKAAVETAATAARHIPYTIKIIDSGPARVKVLATGKQDAFTVASMDTLYDDTGRLDMTKIMSKDDNWWDRFIGHFIDNASGKRFVHNSELTLNGGVKALTAAHFDALNQAIGKMSMDEFRQAFKAIQANLQGVAGPALEEGANRLKNYITDLIGWHGLDPKAWANNTDLSRIGLPMENLNHYMRAMGGKTYFSNSSKLDGPLGLTDHSKNMDWTHSWQNMNIEDPMHFLVTLTSGIIRGTHESMYFRGLSRLPGVITTNAKVVGKVSVEHPLGLTDGMQFPADIAKEANKVIYDLANDFKLGGPGWQMFDNVMRMWKLGNTVVNPVHHIHNLQGDMYLAYLDGVKSFGPYRMAMKFLRSRPDIYQGIGPAPLGQISLEHLAPGGVSKAVNRGVKDSDILFSKVIGGKKVDFDSAKLHVLLNQHGLLPRFSVVEDLPDYAGGTLKKPGKVMNRLGHLSENREHLVRVAHFIDIAKKGKWDSIEHLMNEATRRVRKYHPSGEDLTHTERAVMRRLMPFYSWTRKAVPLVLEAAVMRPNRFLNPFIASHELALANGVEQPGIGNQFPVDQMFPDWMRAGVIGPQFGKAGSYVISNPSLPASSILQQINDPLAGVKQMMSPFFQIPATIATGHDTQTGADVTKDWGSWVNRQVPVGSQLDRISNTNLGPGSLFGTPFQTQSQKDNPNPWFGFLNWISGAGATDTSRFIKSAQKEQQYKQRNKP